MIHEYNDYVFCISCNTEQIVNKGSEFCLNCKEKGCLTWIASMNCEVPKEPHIINKG